MSSIPPEIWARIAFYACTDGGATGVVLQLVSRLVADGTAPHKNDTVMLCNARQTVSLHLYLSSSNLSPIFRRVKDLYIGAATSRQGELVRETWDLDTTIYLSNMLELVSPYLRSLTLVMKDYTFSGLSLPTFPCLESLTLDCVMPITSAPKLTALHVSIYYHHRHSTPHADFVYALYSQATALKRITVASDATWDSMTVLLKLKTFGSDSNCNKDERTGTENFNVVLRDAGQDHSKLTQNLLTVLGLRECQTLVKKENFQFRFVQILEPAEVGRRSPSQLSAQEWSDMFHRAVLRGTGIAEIYAEDYQLESREDHLKFESL
jgi:hypothetical protein